MFGKPIPSRGFRGTSRRQRHIAPQRVRPAEAEQTRTLMRAFDAPVMECNCDKRPASTVATQSLMLMNNEFVLKQAALLAERVRREAASVPPLSADLIPICCRCGRAICGRSGTANSMTQRSGRSRSPNSHTDRSQCKAPQSPRSNHWLLVSECGRRSHRQRSTARSAPPLDRAAGRHGFDFRQPASPQREWRRRSQPNRFQPHRTGGRMDCSE